MRKCNPFPAVAIAMILVMTVFGCSDRNDQAPLFSDTGKHPALSIWYTEHRAAFSSSPQQCTQCHGSDLKGGISKINCFTGIEGIPGFPCHTNGHAPRIVPHDLPFKDAAKHGPLAKSDLVFCQVCHGSEGGAGSNPRFNISIGSLSNGCEDCHLVSTAHPPVNPTILPGYPSTWPGHASAGNMANACSLCHGATLSGPVEAGVGPACKSCHTQLQAGIIPQAGSCISCHEKSPANLSHPSHLTILAANDNCNSCHNGAGIGTALHFNGSADILFPAKFNSKSGTATYNADGSCSQISCHGGVTTPLWGDDTTDLLTTCERCHQRGTSFQTPQFNSYYSGRHSLHLDSIGLKCSDCHDMTVSSNGSSHFSNLGTPAFELSPARTIRVPGYSNNPGSCAPGSTPPAGTYSIGVCHGSESW